MLARLGPSNIVHSWFFRPSRTLMLRSSAHGAGREYEARLRQQHSKLNPRTSWAAQTGRGAKRRRTGYGEDSEDDE